MFNITNLFELSHLDKVVNRPQKSHGLALVKVASGPRGPIMTHAPRGKRWPGPGITGSARRRMQREA